MTLSRAARQRRDAEIVRRYIAGETRGEIGARFGITPRTVSRVLAAASPTMPEVACGRSRRPGGTSTGRPREIILPDEDMRFYRNVRNYYGAARARELLGIPQR